MQLTYSANASHIRALLHETFTLEKQNFGLLIAGVLLSYGKVNGKIVLTGVFRVYKTSIFCFFLNTQYGQSSVA